MELSLPYQLGKYLLTEEIGHGGFSYVYKAKCENYKIDFVAKILKIKEKSSVDHVFNAEVSALTSLNHPNIIRLYDTFVQDDLFVMILEYCPNGCLMDELKKVKAFNYDEFVYYGRQIVDALTYCHSKNIAHRDIKLQNILIDAYGRPKLADFGISMKMENENLAETFNGSLSYTAPEILCKKAYDPFMADVWSLGVTFAIMATGTNPWIGAGETHELKRSIMIGTYQLSKTVNSKIASLIRQMLNIDPKQRILMHKIKNSPVFKMCLPGFNTFSGKTPEFDALSISGRRYSKQFPEHSNNNTSRPEEDQIKLISIYRKNILNGFTTSKRIVPRLTCSRVPTYI
ncbi:CAMK family protein kinase [Tritrichomonas foetus]|uniref:CAMK family protein kinase n=1 Tax=Tritrichomonas foetus TaxID=1144522 RepID=A0A1J4JH83_9EUKA|nr:CAMK family protein kinase [Tritrichomonas foetus]|eukprot:OHS96845.1 CAMK family protein kinase [Tritrichomonas foetus]